MSVEITDLLTPALLGKLARISDPLPVLRAAGAALASASTRSFREPAFRVEPWAPLKPATLKAKRGRGGILIRDAVLFRSILAAEPVGDEIEVGTDRTYGLFHQYGTRRVIQREFSYEKILFQNIDMPARPFIPVADDGTMNPAAELLVAEATEAAIDTLLAD
jgi:phage gpG-like protein